MSPSITPLVAVARLVKLDIVASVTGFSLSPITTANLVKESPMFEIAPVVVLDSLSVLPSIPKTGSCKELIKASLN